MDNLRIHLLPYEANFTLPFTWLKENLPHCILTSALDDPDVTQLDLPNKVVTPEVMTLLVDLAAGGEPVKHVPSLLDAHRYLNIPELLPYADPCYDLVAGCEDLKVLQNSDEMIRIIEEGRMHLYSYLLRKGYQPVDSDLVTAAAIGNLRLTQQLLANETINPAIINTTGGIWRDLVKYPEIIALLLADPKERVDPASQGNDAINWAAQLGKVETVRLLLADPKKRANPAVGQLGGDPLESAARNGYLMVVCLLLADPRVDPTRDYYSYRSSPLSAAASNGHLEVVKVLLDHPMDGKRHYSHRTLQYAFVEACRGGYPHVVQRLIDTKRLDLSMNRRDDDGFAAACRHGRLEVVRLLITHPEIDPSYPHNGPLIQAANEGHVEVMRLLLTDKRVNTPPAKQTALSNAAWYGHLPVIRFLLTEEGVDPSVNHNSAFINAAARGHFEAMELLLEDKRVNPGDRDGEAVIKVAIGGHVDIVKFLLAHPQVSVVKGNFGDLVARQDRAMMKLLLTSPKVDPVDWNNSMINWAGAHRELEILRLLIDKPTIQTSISAERLAHFRKICVE